MNLEDWMSNCKDVMTNIPECNKAKVETMKVLGHVWNTEKDTLSLNVNKSYDMADKCTKREVLKQIAGVYDPMGLFCPVILKCKDFLKTLWNNDVHWDEGLSKDETQHWEKIRSDLEHIPDFELPRYTRVDQRATYKILCFCDASKTAYSTAVYIHQTFDTVTKVDLLFAKTRVAPTKDISISRLELLAVLTGTIAVQYVTKSLQIPISNTYLWTDSK